jgi:site-specific recombinase XerD
MRQRKGHASLRLHSKRTINAYARSAHAFCRWLFEEGHTEVDITNRCALPTVDKPLITILEEDEFQQLLAACDGGQRGRE